MKTLLLVAAFACLGGLPANSGETDEKSKASTEKVIEKRWERLSPVDGKWVKAEYIDVGSGLEDDRLYYRYSPHADSGVQFERVIKAKVVWRSHIMPLGAIHSRYQHNVSVHIVNGVVFIRSSGAKHIYQMHDLDTGKLIKRSDTGFPEPFR